MKKRIQINLSQQAHAELRRRAEVSGLTRQAYIESWLVTDRPKPPQTLKATEALIAETAPVFQVPARDADEILQQAQRKIEERRSGKLCDHGAPPGLCRVAKCRKT